MTGGTPPELGFLLLYQARCLRLQLAIEKGVFHHHSTSFNFFQLLSTSFNFFQLLSTFFQLRAVTRLAVVFKHYQPGTLRVLRLLYNFNFFPFLYTTAACSNV